MRNIRMRREMPDSIPLAVLAVALLLTTTAYGSAIRRESAFSLAGQDEKRGRAAALVAEGAAALEKGDAEAARKLFERAVEDDPNSELAHTYLGIIADG